MAAPIEREPPVTRAVLPVWDWWVMVFAPFCANGAKMAGLFLMD